MRLVAAFYRDSQLSVLLVVLLLQLAALLRVQQQALLQARQAKGPRSLNSQVWMTRWVCSLPEMLFS